MNAVWTLLYWLTNTYIAYTHKVQENKDGNSNDFNSESETSAAGESSLTERDTSAPTTISTIVTRSNSAQATSSTISIAERSIRIPVVIAMNDDSDGDSIEDNNSSSDYDDDSSVSGKSFYHLLAMVHVAREPILIHHSNQVVAERRKSGQNKKEIYT